MKKKNRFLKKVSSLFTYIYLIVKQKPGCLGSPKIVPFLGYGNSYKVFVFGEVVGDNGIAKPREGQSKWQNLKSMVMRYLSNEIEGVRVKITFFGKTAIAVTDKHGFFQTVFDFPEEQPLPGGWQKFSALLTESYRGKFMAEEAIGEVLIINTIPEFGIISDIDDTIILSWAPRKFIKLRLLLLNNAYTRMPFGGVSAFYRALQVGVKKGFNPLFYLSNSDWNLYDLLYEFIEFNRIPKGPLLLRQLKIPFFTSRKKILIYKRHKFEKLVQLFTLYPQMKFILIGDSGQRDPEVYSGIVKFFPDRVLAIYIRDIGLRGKIAAIKHISQKVHDEFKVQMILVKDTEAAARHALDHGFILPESIPSVILEKEKDMQEAQS